MGEGIGLSNPIAWATHPNSCSGAPYKGQGSPCAGFETSLSRPSEQGGERQKAVPTTPSAFFPPPQPDHFLDEHRCEFWLRAGVK